MASNKAVPTRMCRGHNSPLLKCVGTKKETDFYDSWSKFEDGKVGYCRTCCNKIFDYYIKNDCDEASAIYYTLQIMNIPFIEEVYNKVKDSGRKVNISNYVTYLRQNSSKKELWTDFTDTDIELNKLNRTVKEKEEIQAKLEELEKLWGIQDSTQDYEFLEDIFYKYTSGIEFVNPQQIDLYRDLCRDRLLLRKINDKRYDGNESLDAIQKRIEREMSKLKLDEFESNKPKSASEQLIFSKIAQIEQTKPADLYKEPRKYKDFNKIKKYYKDLVLRPLANTLAGNRDFNINIEDIDEYNIETEDT